MRCPTTTHKRRTSPGRKQRQQVTRVPECRWRSYHQQRSRNATPANKAGVVVRATLARGNHGVRGESQLLGRRVVYQALTIDFQERDTHRITLHSACHLGIIQGSEIVLKPQTISSIPDEIEATGLSLVRGMRDHGSRWILRGSLDRLRAHQLSVDIIRPDTLAAHRRMPWRRVRYSVDRSEPKNQERQRDEYGHKPCATARWPGLSCSALRACLSLRADIGSAFLALRHCHDRSSHLPEAFQTATTIAIGKVHPRRSESKRIASPVGSSISQIVASGVQKIAHHACATRLATTPVRPQISCETRKRIFHFDAMPARRLPQSSGLRRVGPDTDRKGAI